MALSESSKIVLLIGGVGGAKLALGLSSILPPEQLTIIVNVADDFHQYGLKICPDLDTITYTLSGIVNTEFGWGIKNDTSNMLHALKQYYDVDEWFQLKDRDLATHLLRTQKMSQGETLTEVTHFLTSALNIKHQILPVSDDTISTIIDTQEYGELSFQEYFVKHRWKPRMRRLYYRNIENASLSPKVVEALKTSNLVIFGPSNPWLSIAPIINIPGFKDLVQENNIPCLAVTPIVGGKAIKGPAAKIMSEMELDVSAKSVAEYYQDLVTYFVNDVRNQTIELQGVISTKFDTIMNNNEDKINLSRNILYWLKGMR